MKYDPESLQSPARTLDWESSNQPSLAISEESNPHHLDSEFDKIHYIDEGRDFEDRGRYFKSIKAKQFFVGSVLHRERLLRKVSWDELFLDLIYVAVINRVGEEIKNANLESAVKFALVLYPVWKSWVLIEYQANRYGENTVQKLFQWLVIVLVSLMGTSSQHVFDTVSTGNLFIISYLLIRLIYFLYICLAVINQPQFWIGLPIQFSLILTSLPWVISIFAADSYRIILWSTSCLCDMIVYYWMLGVYGSVFKPKYKVAINIEHHVERYGLLTLIVIGEVVVGFLWESKSPVLSESYLATIFGILIAISLQWIYFSIDAGKKHIHAVRRSPITALIWQVIHFPLHYCIISVGSIMNAIVTEFVAEDKEEMIVDSPILEVGLMMRQRRLFCIGIALVVFFYTVIGLMHAPTEFQPTKISRNVRTAARFLTSGALVLLAFTSQNFTVPQLFGCVAALLVSLILVLEIGRVQKGKSLTSTLDEK